MNSLDDMKFHPLQEELVEILIKKTQNHNPLFFRVILAYHFARIASMMRVDIDTLDRGLIPINVYAIALSPSGSAKGFSTNIIEDSIINKFKETFLTSTFPSIAMQSIDQLAIKRQTSVISYEDQLEKLEKEFNSLGPLVFAFDSGTAPAVKQMRHKLLMAGIGSINFEQDECYTPEMEILTERGFIYFDELPKDIRVAQYDPEINFIELVKPLNYIDKLVDEKIYHIKGKYTSLKVTGKHQVAVFDENLNKLIKIPANTVTTEHSIPSICNPLTEMIKDRVLEVEIASDYPRRVYCVTVPTGYIIVKHGNKISVCGNCGSNLLNNTEVLNTLIELYDVGKIKQKLIKSTKDNTRMEEIDGRTPTNMLLFGTPSKLLNGTQTESEFFSMLETGYARRCLFGYASHVKKLHDLSAEQVFDMLTDKTADQTLQRLSNKLGNLADPINYKTKIGISKDVSLYNIRYKLMCEKKAEDFRDFEEIQKAEMNHRYYKALKLAGAYAFIDGSMEITQEHLEASIKLVEESGESFNQILSRPKVHERVAKYLASTKSEVTQVDLMEDLPFYRGSATQRKDIMNQAIAWGYRNNIIIKTSYSDNIEFFKGETLENTKLNSIICSYSTDITTGYEADRAPWEDLHKLVCSDGYHYTAHHFIEGYRSSDKLIPGFNLVILDVDNGVSMSTAQMLLKDYRALFATTKRHTPQHNRFRIILPLSHTIKLNSGAYSKFMENVFEWLPFEVDDQTKDCARKWQSFNGEYHYQEGELLDAVLFIPETKKQEEQQKKVVDLANLSNLERWFLLNIGVGNRSNTLIKYAYVLVDSGHTYEAIRNLIYAFNQKLKDPLSDEELQNTILVSAIKAVTKRDMNG